jgi:pilus assembly protein CpaF
VRLSFSDTAARPQTPPAAVSSDERGFHALKLTPLSPAEEAYLRLKTDMHRRLIEAMNLAGLERRLVEEVRAEVGERIAGMLREDARPLSETEIRRLNDDLVHELLGYGPLEPLLRDPEVSDILVNTAREV